MIRLILFVLSRFLEFCRKKKKIFYKFVNTFFRNFENRNVIVFSFTETFIVHYYAVTWYKI